MILDELHIIKMLINLCYHYKYQPLLLSNGIKYNRIHTFMFLEISKIKTLQMN